MTREDRILARCPLKVGDLVSRKGSALIWKVEKLVVYNGCNYVEAKVSNGGRIDRADTVTLAKA